MSCNCKNDKNFDSSLVSENNELINKKQIIVNYVLKTLIFLLFLITLPIFVVLMVWFVFKTLVLNKSIDIKPMVLMLVNKLTPKNVIDEDYDDATEDELILLDVEDITNKKY